MANLLGTSIIDSVQSGFNDMLDTLTALFSTLWGPLLYISTTFLILAIVGKIIMRMGDKFEHPGNSKGWH